jgi:Mg/Co/Ni transporter MgtE
MDPDQAADVIADMTPEKSRDVLSEMPGEEAREVRELLKFEENSAGGMMNTDFIYVGEAATRDEVVSWIQEKDVDLERLDTVFLINKEAKLSGAVAIGRLLLAASDEVMETLKMEPLLSITPDAEDKDVFELFDKYNLHSLAVVDDLGRPIGAIEVDDVVTRIRHR